MIREQNGSLYSLKTFALTGVRCPRLEHGYLPHNHYHSQLEPIYEEGIPGATGKYQKNSSPRRTPSPINVLTNGSFFSGYDTMDRTGNYSKVRRSSSDVNLNHSRMLNEIMGRKYRRNSLPCLTSFKSTNIDIDDGFQTESISNSLESLVIDLEHSANTGSTLSRTEVTSTSRSSIYQGHFGSPIFSKYMVDLTARQESTETFTRPKTVENNFKPYLLCSGEKTIKRRLFLLCFAVFVAMVVFFLISILTGLFFPNFKFKEPTNHNQNWYPDSTTTSLFTPNNMNLTSMK